MSAPDDGGPALQDAARDWQTRRWGLLCGRLSDATRLAPGFRGMGMRRG